MKVFSNVEIEIGVKKSFSCQFAFTILVIPPHIPHGVATIRIIPKVIRNICNYQLCFWYVVPFEILKIIVVQLTFDFLCAFHFSIIPLFRTKIVTTAFLSVGWY
jgi:hypothetical protein